MFTVVIIYQGWHREKRKMTQVQPEKSTPQILDDIENLNVSQTLIISHVTERRAVLPSAAPCWQRPGCPQRWPRWLHTLFSVRRHKRRGWFIQSGWKAYTHDEQSFCLWTDGFYSKEFKFTVQRVNAMWAGWTLRSDVDIKFVLRCNERKQKTILCVNVGNMWEYIPEDS